MGPTKRKRASSVELGTGDFSITYNQQTGRPIRRSAGRRDFDPLSTNTDKALQDLSDTDVSLSETERDLSQSPLPAYNYTGQKARSLEPLSPQPADYKLIRDEVGAIRQPSTAPVGGGMPLEAASDSVQLTFNIPLGFTGPLKVDIPRPMLISQRSSQQMQHHPRPPLYPTSHPTCKPSETENGIKRWGWSSLPAELRNRVYRFLYIQDDTLDFHQPHNFQCSSQFLRTCKQIHSEGREILYPENSFTFERNKQARAPYWTDQAKEIGFKDVRAFLTNIGMMNVSLLRDLTFICDDAIPSTTRELSHDERRFTHDPNLMECIHILTRHGQLRRIQFSFHGRRNLLKTDAIFIAPLKQIRADEVKIIGHPRWQTYDGSAVVSAPSKLPRALQEALEQVMTRKKKLYAR